MNNINQLLDKYWAGESSPAEEADIRSYFKSGQISDEHAELATLFNYFSNEKERRFEGELDLSFLESKPKGRVIRFLPRMVLIAASLAVLLTASLHLFDNGDTMYKNKYTELEDPEEALEITMEALGFLSNKYEKGTEPMNKHFKNLEKTNVFDLN
ncbi:MAG: hypothetical protein HKN09_09680 [Saprospiraceae bacterium]|nr:hypothetical protein [Saprospiraceae bacterium]